MNPNIPFLTNHALVLLAVAADPRARGRDIAEAVGITERRVQVIVKELAATGYVAVRRDGRRNLYEVAGPAPAGGGLAGRTVAEFVQFARGGPDR